MKWVFLILLVLIIASFALGWWADDDNAEDRMIAACYYGLGCILGALLIVLVIVKVIWQAFA